MLLPELWKQETNLEEGSGKKIFLPSTVRAFNGRTVPEDVLQTALCSAFAMARVKLPDPCGISRVLLCSSAFWMERGNDLPSPACRLLTMSRQEMKVTWASRGCTSSAVVSVLFPVLPPVCGSDGQRLSLLQKTTRISPALLRSNARSKLRQLGTLRFLSFQSNVPSTCWELGRERSCSHDAVAALQPGCSWRVPKQRWLSFTEGTEHLLGQPCTRHSHTAPGTAHRQILPCRLG